MFQIYEEYNIKINTDIIIRDCYNKDASYARFDDGNIREEDPR